MLRIFALALMLATPLAAQDLPALYNVVDVASDDTLNVRAKPSSKGAIIAELRPDEAYIQVEAFDESGKWALISTGESGMGWAFARYLEPVPGGHFPDWPHMMCFGSEAPWSFRFTQEGDARYRPYYDDGYALSATSLRTGSEYQTDYGIRATSAQMMVFASIRKERCDSLMIDSYRGLMSTVHVAGEEGAFHQGCCVLMAPPQ